jgi:hypothetical protein
MYQATQWWDNIPHAMRDHAHFMCATHKKVPFNPQEQTFASKDNAAHWMRYGDACYWAEEQGLLIGFVPRPDDPFVIIDLDNKPESNISAEDAALRDQLLAWAIENTYVEKSSSGNGYHVVITGALPADINRGTKRGVEAYSNKGFVILTGNIISKTREIAHSPSTCEWLYTTYAEGTATDRSEGNDFYSLNQEQINNPPQWELDEDQKFLDWASRRKNEKNIRSWFYAEDTGPDGRGGSIKDAALMQLFVKYSSTRKYPDESAMRMFLRSPRGRKLGRKNGSWPKYCMTTLLAAKQMVANDQTREDEQKIDFSEGMAKLIAEKDAMIQRQLDTQSANAVNRAQGILVPPVPPMVFKHQFPTKTAAEVLAEPSIEWAVQGLFQSHAINAIFGWSGVGKSFIALDLAAAVADGVEWFGHKTLKMSVLYVAIEGGNALNQRIGAFEKGHGHQYPQNVEFYRGRFKLRDRELMAEFISQRKAAGWQGGLIIIDTLAKAIVGADENSNGDMGEVVESLELLKSELNACVIIVHHSTKPDPKTGIAGMMRGAGSLQSGIEGVFEVVRKDLREDEMDVKSRVVGVERFIKTAKVKEGDDTGFSRFDLPKVMLDRHDNFGTQLSSCYIERVQEGTSATGVPLPSNFKPTYPDPSDGENRNRKAPYGGAKSTKQKEQHDDDNWSGMKPQEAVKQAITMLAIESQCIGKFGGAGKHCAPRSEVMERAIMLRKYPIPAEGKRAIERAINAMLKGEKLGFHHETPKIQWLWESD